MQFSVLVSSISFVFFKAASLPKMIIGQFSVVSYKGLKFAWSV